MYSGPCFCPMFKFERPIVSYLSILSGQDWSLSLDSYPWMHYLNQEAKFLRDACNLKGEFGIISELF